MTTRFCQHPDLRLAALEGEGIALHLASRRYFTVSETALVMLEALQEPRTPQELSSLLTERYDVTPEHAERSVREFLESCRRADLLIPADRQ